MTNLILILSFLFSAYFWIKELLWLFQFKRRWLYVYWDIEHTNQHIFMILAWMFFWLTMTIMLCFKGCIYIPLIYNILVYPFIIKHIEDERINWK